MESIGGNNISNLWFAKNRNALVKWKQELEALVESSDKSCTRC